MTFDGATKVITLSSATVSAAEIWSAWVNWYPSNSQWGIAITQVGGQSLGGGLYIPPYFFLMNGWKVKPMEQDHLLVINGNLFVDGGGNAVINTVGDFNVSVQYTVPVQAQAFSTSGGSSYTLEQIADAVWANSKAATKGDVYAASLM